MRFPFNFMLYATLRTKLRSTFVRRRLVRKVLHRFSRRFGGENVGFSENFAVLDFMGDVVYNHNEVIL